MVQFELFSYYAICPDTDIILFYVQNLLYQAPETHFCLSNISKILVVLADPHQLQPPGVVYLDQSH